MYWRHRENAWSTLAAQAHSHRLRPLRSVCMNGKCPHTPTPFVVGRIFLSWISVRGRLIYLSTSILGIFGYSFACRLALYDEKFGKYVVPFIAIWGKSYSYYVSDSVRQHHCWGRYGSEMEDFLQKKTNWCLFIRLFSGNFNQLTGHFRHLNVWQGCLNTRWEHFSVRVTLTGTRKCSTANRASV